MEKRQCDAKTENWWKQAPATITFPDPTHEMKTEQIPAQRLPMEQETTPQIKGDPPWMDYEWAQRDWGMNYYGWGIPMTMPTQWEDAP